MMPTNHVILSLHLNLPQLYHDRQNVLFPSIEHPNDMNRQFVDSDIDNGHIASLYIAHICIQHEQQQQHDDRWQHAGNSQNRDEPDENDFTGVLKFAAW